MQMGARSYPQGMTGNRMAPMSNGQRSIRNENCECGQTEQQANRACSDMNEFCKAENGRASVQPVDHMGPTMGYIPWQRWEEIYDMEKGLCQGTIFPNLDKPFKGGRT